MMLNTVAAIGCDALNFGMETLGEKVKRLRGRKPIERIARDAGITRDAIWRLETGKTPNPRWDTIEGLAKAFKLTADELLDGVAEVAHPAPELDNNVPPAPDHPLPIPEWSAEIACGHWVESLTASLDPDTQMAIIAQGRFIVRCVGDSMMPIYRSGDRVLFRIVRMDEEGLRVGADYYWQTSDGQATLKTLKSIGEDEYVLAPRNRKYKPLRVAKQMVSRVAIVETIMRVPWEEAER